MIDGIAGVQMQQLSMTAQSKEKLSGIRLDDGGSLLSSTMHLEANADAAELNVAKEITITPVDRTPKKLERNYLLVFQDVASGKRPEDYDAYADKFAFEAASLMGNEGSLERAAGIKEQLTGLLEEISQGLASGKTLSASELKTTFAVGGVDFTYEQLTGAMEAMQYATSIANKKMGSSLDYRDYAVLGTCIGYVNTYAAQNLNEKQSALLDAGIKTYVDKVLEKQFTTQSAGWKEHENQAADAVPHGGGHVSDEVKALHDRFYEESLVSAKDQKYANQILQLFAGIGDQDPIVSQTNFSQALMRYQAMIRPVIIGNGVRGDSIQAVTQYDLKELTEVFRGTYNPNPYTFEEVKARSEEQQRKYG